MHGGGSRLPNRLVSRERAANEHGSADPKNWRVLTKLRLNAKHATTLLRALLFLTNEEISRWLDTADDLREMITPITSARTSPSTHARPVTSDFRMKTSQSELHLHILSKKEVRFREALVPYRLCSPGRCLAHWDHRLPEPGIRRSGRRLGVLCE
ncbi:hypothetical protein ACFXO2_36430 [Streptomyces sp. NPDC059152]|uniref:hypothetical protein n=1 Tax=Streptomyces sp. NPDC059152 TaxID=3346742 RepID=UPI0036C971C1